MISLNEREDDWQRRVREAWEAKGMEGLAEALEGPDHDLFDHNDLCERMFSSAAEAFAAGRYVGRRQAEERVAA